MAEADGLGGWDAGWSEVGGEKAGQGGGDGMIV
jgi:hypothetical protein